MRQHLVATLTKWGLCFALLSGLMLGLYLLHRNARLEAEGERGGAEAGAASLRNGLVGLEDDEAERYGLKMEAARSVSWVPRVRVYGRVVPNPEATVEVRSPFAGVLRPAANSSWPALGQRIRAEQMLGLVDVRVGPGVRLELK